MHTIQIICAKKTTDFKVMIIGFDCVFLNIYRKDKYINKSMKIKIITILQR